MSQAERTEANHETIAKHSDDVQSARALANYTVGIHQSLNPQLVAQRIATAVQAVTDAGRVSVWVASGKKFQPLAFSGVGNVKKRTVAVRSLANCARVCARWETMIRYPAEHDQLPPVIQQCLAEYFDQVSLSDLAVIHLQRHAPRDEMGEEAVGDDEPSVGLLIIEAFQRELGSGEIATAEAYAGPAASALANAWQHHRLPLRRTRQLLGVLAPSGRLPIALLLICGFLAALLLFIQVDFKVRAEGTLIPNPLTRLFAPEAAVVAAVETYDGAAVAAGDLVLQLRSYELELELAQAEGQIEAKREVLAGLRSLRSSGRESSANRADRGSQTAAREEETRRELEALQRQLEWLLVRQQKLAITSPVSGNVISWQPAERLAGRPVERGELLLEVVQDDASWEIELRVPGKDAGYVLTAFRQDQTLAATGIVISQSVEPLQGEVLTLANQMELAEDGQSRFLRGRMQISNGIKLTPRAGVGARVMVDCGKCSLGYALFHGLLDRLNAEWTMRFGEPAQ